METDLFWLSDRQFARLSPLLPTETRGVAAYGPHKTNCNRFFVRWAAPGVWREVFKTLARAGGPVHAEVHQGFVDGGVSIGHHGAGVAMARAVEIVLDRKGF